jgi:hypothetical protein
LLLRTEPGGGAVGMSYGANAKADGKYHHDDHVELVTLPHTEPVGLFMISSADHDGQQRL